ncbi:enoyl-CoA hydratase, partial [Reticulomyxa filosa]
MAKESKSFFVTRVVAPGVLELCMNEPKLYNRMDARFWDELPLVCSKIGQDKSVHVVLLTGEGKNFCSGIDLSFLVSIGSKQKGSDPGRTSVCVSQIYNFGFYYIYIYVYVFVDKHTYKKKILKKASFNGVYKIRTKFDRESFIVASACYRLCPRLLIGE